MPALKIAICIVLFIQRKFEIRLTCRCICKSWQPVAYAGFWKGGGAGNSENLRITNSRMKIFPPRISQSSVGNTAPFQDMLQRWRAVGKTVSDLTDPRFEPPTSRSRDERITARPTGQ